MNIYETLFNHLQDTTSQPAAAVAQLQTYITRNTDKLTAALTPELSLTLSTLCDNYEELIHLTAFAAYKQGAKTVLSLALT